MQCMKQNSAGKVCVLQGSLYTPITSTTHRVKASARWRPVMKKPEAIQNDNTSAPDGLLHDTPAAQFIILYLTAYIFHHLVLELVQEELPKQSSNDPLGFQNTLHASELIAASWPSKSGPINAKKKQQGKKRQKRRCGKHSKHFIFSMLHLRLYVLPRCYTSR